MSYQYIVYHTENFNDWFFDKDHDNLIINNRPVAFVNANSLDEVYSKTNSTYDSWVKPRDKGVMIGLRSTSIGDIIYDRKEQKAYIVDNYGFVEYKGAFKFSGL